MTRRWALLSAAACACGGTPTPDAGADASMGDATILDATDELPTNNDSGVSKYVDIDGGRDCGIEAIDAGPKYGQTWTCCNGTPCRGRCVTEPDASAMPFCYCAGVTGGCPAPFVCCVNPVVYPDGYCDKYCPSQGN